ncbi:hypothetical protein, partial [Bifidobacterium apri]|uniref:hypothetical protein n=1 Tax=Bifidobacterium apri TaxID=1769423 RepID=UPI0035E81254
MANTNTHRHNPQTHRHNPQAHAQTKGPAGLASPYRVFLGLPYSVRLRLCGSTGHGYAVSQSPLH